MEMYGFEMWLDKETSILVGLLTKAIVAGISITTKTSLVTQVNKAVGGKTGATINYYTRDLNIALRYLPYVSAVVLGSLAAQAAFTATGVGGVIVSLIKVILFVYGGYVSSRGAFMVAYGILYQGSYTKFKLGKITVSKIN